MGLSGKVILIGLIEGDSMGVMQVCVGSRKSAVNKIKGRQWGRPGDGIPNFLELRWCRAACSKVVEFCMVRPNMARNACPGSRSDGQRVQRGSAA